MSKTLLVTIESTGRIPAIGCDGPILVPTHLDANLVKKLVMNGVIVNAHDPNEIRHKVRLNRKNIDENHFPPVVPEPPVKPVGKEIPEVSLEKPSVTVPPVEETPVEEESVQEEEPVENVEKVEEVKPVQNVAPAPTVDKYAGMSKNQRRRARQAEAAAAAEARAKANSNPTE